MAFSKGPNARFSAVCQTTASMAGLSYRPHLRSEVWFKGHACATGHIEHEIIRGEVSERSIEAVLKHARMT